MPADEKDFPVCPAGQRFEKGSPCPTAGHTGAEVQRLERLAGRELKYRELLKEADRERAVAKVAEMKAAEEAAKKPQEPDPFVEAIFGGCRSPDIR